VFCADSAEVTEPDWLLRLLLHTRLPNVVAAGPLIARPDGRTEAAGIAVGLDHPAMPMLADVDAEADGYYGSLSSSRDVSALRGDFLLVERAAFKRAGGFEENYLTGYEDFDLCQRLREAGGGVVYASRPRVVVHETPAARHERLDIVDRALFVDRWYEELERGDPFYNPNFIRDAAAFAIG
jgi:GT2 family glycosyltransferase